MTAVKKTNSFQIESLLDTRYLGKVELCDFFDANKKDNVIRISLNEPSDVVLKKAKDFNSFFSIQQDSYAPEKALNLAAQMLLAPKQFFTDPINYILNPTQNQNIKVTTIINRNFSKLEEKYLILSEIEKAVQNTINSGSMMYDVESISDEFITNAIFHATHEVKTRKDHMINGAFGNIKIGITEDELVISCLDPHGTLQPKNLFSRIYTCTTTDIASSINMGNGGAGIGSFLVHSMSAYYIIAVEENIQTIFSTVLPLKMSNRKRLKLPKNLLSIFLKENEDG
ncbi:MAG: hypothetical protein H6625_05620 [Bdellovibrionaceae bacterium]|nr:hypothetical protein [Pseudobdellovibrionaceae bacterium]